MVMLIPVVVVSLAGCMAPLHKAAMNNDTASVRSLLAAGAPVNQPAGAGNLTPLHYAAITGAFESARILLDAGANVFAQSYRGTPREAAISVHQKKTANLIEAYERQQLGQMDAMPVRVAAAAAPEPAAAPVVPTRTVASAPVSLAPNFSNASAVEDYAVIVGIENYPDLPAATYAERDAAAARNFIRALGVPERNIVLLTGNRATKTGMEKTLEAWLPNNISEKSRVYFYYSGHGAPDTKTGDAYLVPSDGDPQYLAQTGYPLKRLYAKLGQLKAKSVLVALDSCFSGAGGRSVLAKGTRPLVGKVDMAVQSDGKVSVLSASAGDQVSGTNEEAGYGLFTYNLLQGLNGAAKDAQGQVTLKSLFGYLKPRVQDEARRGNRDQTPQLQSAGSEDLVLRAK
jgi:hypothetical protein